MDWSCIKNETRFVTKNCANMSTRREERERGRPREIWRRTVEREICEMGLKTWTEAARIAIDRKRWKDTIKSPILQVE